MGPHHQDAGGGKELALAAGERGGLAPEEVRDRDAGRNLRDALPDRLARLAEILRPECELGLHGGAHDLAGRVLEHRSDGQGDVAQPEVGRGPTVDPDRAVELARIGVRDEAVDRPDEGALATSRGSRDEQDLARVQGQIEVSQRRLRRSAVAEGELLDLQQRRGHARAARRLRRP